VPLYGTVTANRSRGPEHSLIVLIFPTIKEIMIGTTSSGISHQLRDIYSIYAGTAGILLHINGKFTIGK
jgi:hypothetical protein